MVMACHGQEKGVVSARGGGPQGLPFNEVNPSYEADQDIWGRTLDITNEDRHGERFGDFNEGGHHDSMGICQNHRKPYRKMMV